MLCHIIRPDSVVMEVEVDPKAVGEDCLSKVCQRLGIIEADYFGLQFNGSKGESLWLNLRNRISHQVDCGCPWRLKLLVKFFVEPHLILQEQTRHFFLMHVKEELVRGSLRLDSEQEVELCALLAQAEYGDYNQNTAEYFYTRIYGQQPSPATMNSITERHKELRGISQASAEYRALQLVSSLENYGETEDQQCAVATYRDPLPCAVWSMGNLPIFVCYRIMYSAIQMATQSRKNVYVTITKESGDALVLIFKFITTGAAVGLLDCAITEIHQLTIMTEYNGGLRSSTLSTDLGNAYVFHVCRTSREVHDRTRRALFSAGPGAAGRGGSGVSPARRAREEEDEDESTCKSCSKTHLLHEKLQSLQEALTCALCCEVELNSAFYPCGHAACCYNCAAQLQWCPVCRSGDENVRRIYLPTCASLLGLTEPRGKANTAPGRPRGSQSLAEKSVARMSVASS
uniref:RING-type E3 ubiquitin transferase n=1 Tax=Electrophorus electricus TaxID=8005 RepID=A0A4W4GBM1_ELEEL